MIAHLLQSSALVANLPPIRRFDAETPLYIGERQAYGFLWFSAEVRF